MTLKDTPNSFLQRLFPFRIIPDASWRIFWIFLIINVIQGIFTPLLNDEAYYWVYSRQLAWGYFDHPPMIAWIISLGYFLFQNEIGVRLLGIILANLSFFLIYKIIEKESDEKVNFGIVLLMIGGSMFLNLYSFMAIPDTPLLFFTILFLWQYQRFLEKDNIANSILLGLISALLVYSKYHGVLVIAFTVMANPKLFTKKSFYIVFVTAMVLFIPHLVWQFQNDFQTIRFHLIDKGSSFRLTHILSYVGEQLAFAGPLILLLFTILQKTKNQFQYTLKFVSLGIFIFFLIASFRGMVNAYWTLVAWPGILILAYLYITRTKQYRKWIYTVFVLGIGLVILMRVNFMFNLLPIRNFNNRNPRQMASQLSDSTQYPLVFENMFIDPSYYLFYQNDSCYAINNNTYKKTQFNYLKRYEHFVQEKTVTMVTGFALNESSRSVSISKGKTYHLTDVRNFRSYQSSWHVKAAFLPHFVSNTELVIPITIQNLSKGSYCPSELQPNYISFEMQDRESKASYTFCHQFKNPGNFDFQLTVPSKTGTYKSFFSISQDTTLLMRTYNSDIYNIDIE